MKDIRSTRLATAVLLTALCLPALSQNRYANVTVQTTRLTDRVYMLEGAGGNVGVSVGTDGVLIVDTQYAPLTERLLKAIRALSTGPIQYVINTHWHHDHTSGNSNFANMGATIIAHHSLRPRLTVKQTLRAWNMEFQPMAPSALPVVTYKDAMTLHFNGGRIHLKHPPRAHTDGDTIVHFADDNVIHMGDILATDRFPFIDRGAKGSMAGMIAAFDYAISLSDGDTKVIPGHGALTNRDQLVEYRAMLDQSRTVVRALIDAGKSRDEVIDAKPLSGLAGRWAKTWMTADFFTEIVFDLETQR